MRFGALLAGAVALTLAAPAGGTIRRDGIGGVRLVMTPRQVWAVRGRPDRVVNRRQWAVGYLPLTYVYRRPRLRIDFLNGGRGLTVWSITTTDPTERTAAGVGVGDREARVRTYAPFCRRERRRRFCSTTNEGGVGGTFFEIRDGRAVSVTVSAPPF
ncbi:MAG TPA: hypothetical protein VF101_18010 [Gaiellaceae bacterium]